ncbi:GNAT family N-acetyltransferase [Kitasatospora purpeofusca]|uniref:GNAT family N-acetyltransferase n=1 Tax=Kitasatospora purpeofusca TaxID=67352 RepID=UPI0036E9E1CA
MTALRPERSVRAELLRIEEVPARSWTTLLGERDLFLLPGWMEVGPGTYGGGLRDARAALVDRDGTAVAGTAGWLFGRDCTEDLCRPDVLLEIPEPRGAPLFPTLLAGGWYDSRVAHRPGGAGPAELAAVVDSLAEWGRSEGAASVCWPSVDERERDLVALLAERGYRRFPLTPRWALEGPWTGFDDYLDRMTSKRRVSVRSERRRVRAAGITCRTVPLTRELARPLVELAEENVTRHGGRVDLDRYADWVAALTGIEDGRAEAHLAERDGRILGCVVSSTYAGRVYALFPGFDYEQIAGLPVYFELAYYHLVEHAAAHGYHAVEYGPAADEAKNLRGCVAHRQALWIRGLDPAAERLVAELAAEATAVAAGPAVATGPAVPADDAPAGRGA